MNKEFFVDSVIITTTTGMVIGSFVGLYNGFQLSKNQASFTDKIKLTLGGSLKGILQGFGIGCYPIYPVYLLVYLMDEYDIAEFERKRKAIVK
jgi:hypothetical protein